MPEALNAVLAYAFDTLHKAAVWGGHYTENAQSGRVMAKCGMKPVFESTHDYFSLIDEYHDTVFHIVTAGENTRDSLYGIPEISGDIPSGLNDRNTKRMAPRELPVPDQPQGGLGLTAPGQVGINERRIK